MTFDLDRFRQWLTLQGYATSTVQACITDATFIASMVSKDEGLPRRVLPTIKRLDKWGHASELVTLAKKNVSDDHKRRTREARSIADDDWKKLLAAIEADTTPAARVVEVMGATGLRVGDVLRIDRDTILTGVPRGQMEIRLKGNLYRRQTTEGAEDAWNKLRTVVASSSPDAANVAACISASAVCEGASPAYMAVRRVIQRHAKAVGIAEPVWTHRFRRTVGVQAYRLTKDVLAVRDVLNHRSVKTTETYLSEARDDRVVDIRKQIKKKFREGR